MRRALRRLVRVKDGEARQWRPTGDDPIDEVRDADEDGRPDLLRLAPFEYRSYFEPSTLRYPHRSLPEGGFSTSDDGVAAWYRKACGGARVELTSAPRSDSPGDLLDLVVCARLWGASSEEVTARVAPSLQISVAAMGGDAPYLPEVPVTLR